MRISDWSSDVCSSDLPGAARPAPGAGTPRGGRSIRPPRMHARHRRGEFPARAGRRARRRGRGDARVDLARADRKSVVEGKSVSVRVDLGGRRIIKKKKNQTTTKQIT